MPGEDSLNQGTPRARSRILITGPGGRVGSQIVPLLRQEFALRLLDLNPLDPQGDDETRPGDIRDLPFLRQASEGMAALVHLAAVPDEDDFHSRLLPMNLAGAYNAFEAARLAGVPKVIFASTGQTVRHYPHGQRVSPDMLARPVTVYACTKLFGEALGRYYADAHGLSVICIRICWFQPYSSPLLQTETGYQQEWCSPRDLAQLIVKSIRASLKFAIFFGISDNPGRTWDISNAQRLVGYAPEDRISGSADQRING